jgi:hypothetical protein
MSSGEACVAPRECDRPTAGRRGAGAEAFELEGMDACYIHTDGLRLTGADTERPESAPIANEHDGRLEMRGQLGPESNSGLEPASVMVHRICGKRSRVTDVTVERDALGVNSPGYLDRAVAHQLTEVPGRGQVREV